MTGGWWVWLVAFAVLALLVVFGAGGRKPRRGRPAALDPADEEDLAQVFARVEAEAAHEQLLTHLADRLDGLVARRVPVRAVRAAPRSGLVRLGFADSTVLVARAVHPTELAALAMVVADRHVVPQSYSLRPEGLDLLLGWGSGTATLQVVGDDQAD